MGGMKLPRFGTLALLVVACILAVGAVGLLRVSRSYAVTANFARMPPDDKSLGDWLKVQPGVVARTVHAGRKGDGLHVAFIMSQTVSGSPQFSLQGLKDTCARLGYEPSGDWTDDELPISF